MTQTPLVEVMREAWADPSIDLPSYESAGAAGADLRANLPPEQRQVGVTLDPGERALIPTGLRVAIPDGFEMQIRARSGLALKKGISLANAVGTIDCDYRGPLGVILVNLGQETVTIGHGDRIAQAIVAPVVRAAFEIREQLPDTVRGSGGFGSTGSA